ncbi:Fe2+/Zn2+ uptake regulation protein [Legionella beliardensis]|uniref:Fe2+/Zn2+ uptake regulation protein n=2 Tax=Legionella beliardensis TaxID=91822 RepID=A0A378JSG2_9GAMM|nr:DUF4400 domain-containing protein [Legionella beliardensis]STX55455.1 Fe2+/Zn2+ uptake regulation protein [Legionella beliardensis]STX55527.1 Fe2+/Zn2+ uptake regulation protein [Legionella beliardensis]
MRVERLSMQERGLVNALQPLAWHLEGSTSRSFKNEWQHWHAQAAQTAHQFKQALDLPLQTLNAEFKATRASSSLTDFLSTLTTFFKRVYLLGCACAHVLWLKILLCIAAIPLFVLTSLAGLIDGLNQRAIRTASLGRESTYVFHKSLPLARKTLFWVLVMWLALPFCFNPTGLFMGLSVGLAIVMSTSASRFKKYL